MALIEQTRCPNPDCLQVFATQGFVDNKGACPHCGQALTARVMAFAEIAQREQDRHTSAGTACGDFAYDQQGELLTALVEDIRSLWNVGSIFRSADGAGFSRLFLTGITGCPPRKEIAKVSLGAEESVAWCYHWNSLHVLRELKTRGVFILGLERNEQSTPLADFRMTKAEQRICLVVGNEVSGLSQQVLSQCDAVCDLPMRGLKESLNVAVAFGIASYAIAGQASAAAQKPA